MKKEAYIFFQFRIFLYHFFKILSGFSSKKAHPLQQACLIFLFRREFRQFSDYLLENLSLLNNYRFGSQIFLLFIRMMTAWYQISMRILLLQAEFFNALVFADLCYCSYYVCPVAYLRVNLQVEEVPEYLKRETIPTLLLLLYYTYNALSKHTLLYMNKTFIHYSFLLYVVNLN